MARTFEEKMNYNRQKARNSNDSFAVGYILGGDIYTDYLKAPRDMKAVMRSLVDSYMQSARADKTNLFAKGFAAGYRDAAAARRQNRLQCP